MNIRHPLRTTIVGVSAVAIAVAVGFTVIDPTADPAPPPTTVIVAEPTAPAPRPAYLIIQDEIDRALAERDSGD